MNFFKNFDWSFRSIAKVVGLALLGVVAFSIVVALIGFTFRTIFQAPGYNGAYPVDYGYGGGAPMMAEMAMDESFAVRSKIMPPTPGPEFSTGTDAEAYEVKTFSATIKSRKLEDTCAKVMALKVKDYVIFENSNQNDENCYFSFKVKKENEKEVLTLIEQLKPEDLNENVQTIKGTIEYYDKQLEILEKKLASVEETLENAQVTYDEISKLASEKGDVETLATVINNKLNLIERLTNERMSIKQQIDRYNQNKADQMERLEFSFFNINIFKDKIFDWKQIKDSWKFEFKALVNNVNEVLQGVTTDLVTYLIRFAQIALYFFITVFFLKFVWLLTKRIWKGKAKPKAKR
jgi:prefoldin subunit 5